MEIQIDYWFLVFLRVLRNKLQVRMHTLCTRLTSRKISYEKFTNLWTSKRLNLAIKFYKLNKSTLNQSSYVTSFNKYIIVSSSLRVPILERISPPRNCDAKKLSSTAAFYFSPGKMEGGLDNAMVTRQMLNRVSIVYGFYLHVWNFTFNFFLWWMWRGNKVHLKGKLYPRNKVIYCLKQKSVNYAALSLP